MKVSRSYKEEETIINIKVKSRPSVLKIKASIAFY